MNCSLLTNLEISELVTEAFLAKKFTLKSCCEAFNHAYEKQISDGKVVPLDKDFICRVRTNRFEVQSDRVVKLCEFLGIDIKRSLPQNTHKFQKELVRINKAIEQDPSLEIKVRNLLKNIADIASVQGV